MRHEDATTTTTCGICTNGGPNGDCIRRNRAVGRLFVSELNEQVYKDARVSPLEEHTDPSNHNTTPLLSPWRPLKPF